MPAVAVPSSRRLFGLDLLRTGAILGVVVAHSLVFLYPHLKPVRLTAHLQLNLGYLGHGGYYGVELFFALSGFLIGRILWRTGERLGHPRELLRFFARRWFRTLPAYFLFLALNVAVFVWVIPLDFAWDRLPLYLGFLQWFDQNRSFFFAESWSLCIEEWFYLLFPALVFVLLRGRVSHQTAFLSAGALFYLLSTWYRWHLAGLDGAHWSVGPRQVTLARFDALMVGIFAAWVSVRFPAVFHRVRRPLALVGGAGLLYAYVTLFRPDAEQSRLFGGTLRFNLVSAGFACLLPWAFHLQRSPWRWCDAAVHRLACWSYAMYLSNLLIWHLLLNKVLPDYQTSAGQGIGGWFLFMTLTIGLSAAVYRWFELPCTNLRDRFDFSRASRQAPQTQSPG